jgi:hypothetical protein
MPRNKHVSAGWSSSCFEWQQTQFTSEVLAVHVGTASAVTIISGCSPRFAAKASLLALRLSTLMLAVKLAAFNEPACTAVQLSAVQELFLSVSILLIATLSRHACKHMRCGGRTQCNEQIPDAGSAANVSACEAGQMTDNAA